MFMGIPPPIQYIQVQASSFSVYSISTIYKKHAYLQGPLNLLSHHAKDMLGN